MKSRKFEKCFICKNKLKYYLTGQDFFYSVNNKKFDLYLCEKCKLKIINPLLQQEELSLYYPKDYYSYNELQNESILKKLKRKLIGINYSPTMSGPFAMFLRFINKIFDVEMYFGIPLKNKGNNRFLDIGCGDGEFVKIMSENGWESYGYEIGEEQKNNNIYKSPNFGKLSFDNKKFDCIRMWHVFEHITTPGEYLKKMRLLLTDDGIIYIGIPNSDSINATLFKQYWLGYDIPRHQINYNLNNITILLNEFGFEVVKCYYSGNLFFTSLNLLFKSIFTNINIIKFPFVLSTITSLFYKKDSLALLVKKNNRI